VIYSPLYFEISEKFELSFRPLLSRLTILNNKLDSKTWFNYRQAVNPITIKLNSTASSVQRIKCAAIAHKKAWTINPTGAVRETPTNGYEFSN